MELPNIEERFLDDKGRVNATWQRFLRNLGPATDIADLQAAVAALQAELAAIGTPRDVIGQYSIQAIPGDGAYYLHLLGDTEEPGFTYYYGTGPDGLKGWYPVADTVEAATDELTKAVDAEGVITFGLADVTPAVGGTLQLTTFDAKGRRSHEDDATAADLPYDNATSGLTATDTQAAIDELAALSGGGVADGDKGDITVSGSGTVWNIDAGAVGTTELANDAVTYAKMQNVSAASRLLGRGDSGSGDVEEITLGSGLAMTGTTLSASGGGGGGGYSEGASFPGSPASGDKFYRTDLNLLCYYDGTRWLTVQEFDLASSMMDALPGTTLANVTAGRFAIRSDFSVWLVRWAVTTYVATTNTGAVYWTFALSRGGTAISSFTTAADAPNTYVQHDQAIGAALPANAAQVTCSASKTGSPGGIYPAMSLIYRLIVT